MATKEDRLIKAIESIDNSLCNMDAHLEEISGTLSQIWEKIEDLEIIPAESEVEE
jgi:archaellum component FlaC